jgi:triacylglycerol lipase
VRARTIVFIHGMGGWGPDDLGGRFPYWGDAFGQFGPPFSLHEAKCGPISSLHDRACEVFAQIMGTRIDYGEAHSETAGHARFSRDFSGRGFLPDWSEDDPVILVGHSAGAPTALLLQKLLEQDFWGVGSNANWVEAIVSIAGALNGSTLAYNVCNDATGRLQARPSSVVGQGLALLARVLHRGSPPLFDLHLDQWIGPEGNGEASDRTAFSRFAASDDNLLHDMTLHGARRTLETCETFFDTYYLSLVARATTPQRRFSLPFLPLVERPDLTMILRQPYGGLYICHRGEFAAPPIEGWGEGELTMEQWRANDGCVNSISQRYPFLAGRHPVRCEGVLSNARLARGGWYYEELEDAIGRKFDHLDPVHGAMYRTSAAQREAHRALYAKLYARLLALREGAHSAPAQAACA